MSSKRSVPTFIQHFVVRFWEAVEFQDVLADEERPLVAGFGGYSFWQILLVPSLHNHLKISVFTIASIPAAMPSGFQWAIPSECVSWNSPFLALVTEGVIVTRLRKIAKATNVWPPLWRRI